MSALNIKINYKSLTSPKSSMAASSVQKVCCPRARSNQIGLFWDLLPISDLIGGAVGAAPEFRKFWMLSPAARAGWHCRGGAGWAGMNLQG